MQSPDLHVTGERSAMPPTHHESVKAPNVVGIDVGGANLKAASLSHASQSCFFPLWKTPELLSAELRDLLGKLCQRDSSLDIDSDSNVLAVTMTGELADCFRNKREGVRFIVDASMAVVQELGWQDALFYGVDGRFHSASNAKRETDVIAAANWHAMARHVADSVGGSGWLVDVGSTTCDIIRFSDGVISTASRTDHDRLCSGELVYVGCQRTPWCALVDEVVGTDHATAVPIMNELFATTDDAALVLGHTDENSLCFDTADGQPRTKIAATARIARLVGLDDQHIDQAMVTRMSEQVIEAARKQIRRAAQRVSAETLSEASEENTVVLCGHGQWLIPETITSDLGLDAKSRIVDWVDQVGFAASRCGPAFAVASLLFRESNAMARS